MPSIGHLVLGALLGICLYYLSDKKFTKCHVFILFMNNYLGPDVGWVTDFGWLSHTVFGFAIFALPLALMYSYFTRFSPDFKRMTLTDLSKVRVPYLNTYCLVLAGGTLHNYLDGVINYGGNFSIFPSMGSIPQYNMSIADFTYLWNHGALMNSAITIVVGIPFIMGFIFFFSRLLKDTPSKALIGMVFYVAAFLACYYLFGYNMTFHGDAGAIVFVALFWGFPIGLITLSVTLPSKKDRQESQPAEATTVPIRVPEELPPVVQKTARGVILGRIVLVFFFLIGVLLLVAGAGVLLFANSIVNWIVSYDPAFWGLYTAQLTNFLFFGGLLLLFGSLVCIIAGIKLRKVDAPDFRFVLFHAWLFASGFVATLVAIGALILAAPGVAYIFNNPDWGSMIASIVTQAQLTLIVQGAGILFGILGLFNYFLGFGLLMRSEGLRRLTFLYNICWAWSIIGLVFACYLSQDDVRAKFHRSRDPNTI